LIMFPPPPPFQNSKAPRGAFFVVIFPALKADLAPRAS